MQNEKDRVSFMQCRTFLPSWPRRSRPGKAETALLLSALLLTGLFIGCDSNGTAPKAPQVVTQKIVQEKTPAPGPSTPIPEVQEAPPATKTEAGTPPQAPEGPTAPPKGADILALLGLGPKETTAAGSYDPKGKIDPFEPLFQQEPAGKAQKKKVRKGPLTPLEKVDLSQLKLTGVILAQSGNRALIKEASGKGYIVKAGTPIGINSGKILQILKDRIVVEEEVEDVMGNVSVQKREMTLQKPPGE